MKKLVKLSAVVLTAGLFVGCATNDDIESLQSQIDLLNDQTERALTQSGEAKNAATDAAESAAAAEIAAIEAARLAEDTNSKLDRMFKQSMSK
jgi:outer membrane murein-binding lipoprotein Lpp